MTSRDEASDVLTGVMAGIVTAVLLWPHNPYAAVLAAYVVFVVVVRVIRR